MVSAFAVALAFGPPLWRRRLGDQARNGVRAWMRARFRKHRTCYRKPLPTAANSRLHRERHIGVAFSLVTFSWRSKRK